GPGRTVTNRMRLLNTTESKALSKYINNLTERGLHPIASTDRNLAAGIAGRQPGNY
ncbi:hypothetical protein K432DRAFT_305100, partial [Lepidopterella palustris CBS 459.81]